MAALTINGVDYDVRTDGAKKSKPRTIGTVSQSFSGKLRTQVHLLKSDWSFSLSPMSIDDYNTLCAASVTGPIVATGDLLGGLSFPVLVNIGDADFIEDENLGIRVVVTVQIQEVG